MRMELEQYIRREHADANLTLYGSSRNGFGFADSDVDMCLTFDKNPQGNVS